MSPDIVRRLSSGRWLIPILAAMTEESGSRFGTLARRLGVSRTILSKGLDRLVEWDWICRNPGHGHPLRPEYLLTPTGWPVASWCARVLDQRNRLGIESSGLGRWSLPLIVTLGDAPKRFSTLQQHLAPVTARALSLTLKKALHGSLVEQLPAAALYGLTPRGRSLAFALD